MGWALLVKRSKLVAVAAVEAQAGPEFRQAVRFDPGRLHLVNTETGEEREWDGGLDGLMSTYEFYRDRFEHYRGLCERVAAALGPDVLRRWADGDEGLDLAAEVAALRAERGR